MVSARALGSFLVFLFLRITVFISHSIDNYDKFSAQFDRVIAVDWLGMGGSHRPDKYPTLSVFNNMMCTKMTPTVASDFFIDSLEEFRQSLGLTDFTLAGHSLGGYLSARYVLKYPSHASALVLISPVGLVDQPPKETHLPKSTRMRVLDCVWSLNYTPQDIVRIAGPKGPGMVRGVLSRRFGERWEEPATSLIADYLYHITAAPGAGEYCMNALLQPIMSSDHSGVFAREPLNKQMTDIRVPVLLMYGDHDWLRFPQAQEYVDRWNRSGADVSLALVSNAGHHLYMDNNDSFHNVINNWTRRKQLV